MNRSVLEQNFHLLVMTFLLWRTTQLMGRNCGHISVMLYVSDLKRSVAFYREKLGFEFIGYWDTENHRVVDHYSEANEPGYAAVQIGESKVGLHLDPEYEGGRPRAPELHVEVDDADDTYSELTKQRVDATEPENQPWGARMFSVTAPDGHIWDFVEPLEKN